MSYNDYLERKWRIGFKFFDLNKDGVWTPEDFHVVPDHISMVTNATDEEVKTFRTFWVKWFEMINDNSNTAFISEEKIITQMRSLYTQNVEGVRDMDRVTYSELFDMLDTNHDGKISLEEMTVYYECHGVDNKEFVQKVFKQLDMDGDGFVSRDELAKAGVEFWWNPDPTGGYHVMYDPEGQCLGTGK